MDIHEIRAEVARRKKAADAKISRLRKKGVQLTGSEFDVRRDPARVARYNSRQLQSYLGKLNEFTSRSKQFVAGSEGVPIPAHVYNHAQRVAKEYNTFVGERESAIFGLKLPTIDSGNPALEKAKMTIGDFQRDAANTRNRGKGGVPRPLTKEVRDAFEFVNADRVQDWQNSLQQKMRPGYMSERIEKQRYQMLQAVSNFGDPELLEMAKSLDNDQLDTLWNYTDAPRDLFAGYHFQQLMSSGKADETQANIHEDATHETRQWLEWASKLPARGNR